MVDHKRLVRYPATVANRKRPQPRPERRITKFAPGLWVEPLKHVAEFTLDGSMNVHAEMDLDPSTFTAVVERIEITRSETAPIDLAVLRSITLPMLAFDASLRGSRARFWTDETATTEVTQDRIEGENLEQWAARLAFMATLGNWGHPAQIVARVQGITIGSAYQRLSVARKMGLLAPLDKLKGKD